MPAMMNAGICQINVCLRQFKRRHFTIQTEVTGIAYYVQIQKKFSSQ